MFLVGEMMFLVPKKCWVKSLAATGEWQVVQGCSNWVAATTLGTQQSLAASNSDRGTVIIIIGSMVLLYMVTWIPSIYPKC